MQKSQKEWIQKFQKRQKKQKPLLNGKFKMEKFNAFVSSVSSETFVSILFILKFAVDIFGIDAENCYLCTAITNTSVLPTQSKRFVNNLTA